MIDEKKLIEELIDMQMENAVEGKEREYAIIEKIIEGVKAQPKKNNWNLCDKRLPKATNTEYVVALRVWNGEIRYDVCQYTSKGWDVEEKDCKVVAWKLLGEFKNVKMQDIDESTPRRSQFIFNGTLDTE